MTATAEPRPRTRGTSNTNERGNTTDRRRRREYLVATYRANVDVRTYLPNPEEGPLIEVRLGTGTPACRCYRCGRLLTVDTVTADRIIPGCKGGTYRRSNIRPACEDCNSETGGPLANGKEHQAAKRRAKRKKASP